MGAPNGSRLCPQVSETSPRRQARFPTLWRADPSSLEVCLAGFLFRLPHRIRWQSLRAGLWLQGHQVPVIGEGCGGPMSTVPQPGLQACRAFPSPLEPSAAVTHPPSLLLRGWTHLPSVCSSHCPRPSPQPEDPALYLPVGRYWCWSSPSRGMPLQSAMLARALADTRTHTHTHRRQQSRNTLSDHVPSPAVPRQGHEDHGTGTFYYLVSTIDCPQEIQTPSTH